ncbi:MAG TPA: M1 family aminopeptidase [Saprospiraceae bacterium]|nr:M1 family aminopeptidase [Saprospiraceae bacterium]HMQ83877.1 M1 family aminopeptidase [Saprospiraceae bacterium]
MPKPMMLAILKNELSFWSRNPLTYFLLFGYCLLALLLVLGNGGYFDDPVSGNSSDVLPLTPYALSLISLFLTKLLLLVSSVFVGFSLHRDISSNIYAILFTYPLGKKDYLLGKLFSGILLVVVSILALMLGVYLAELILNKSMEKLNASAYWVTFGVYTFATLMALSLLVFSIVGQTRNIFAGFLAAVALLLVQLMAENLFFNYPILLGLFDPVGENAFQFATSDWNMARKQSLDLPFHALVLYNRFFWLGISGMVFALFYTQFDFQYQLHFTGGPARRFRNRRFLQEKPSFVKHIPVKADFSLKGHLFGFIYQTVKEWLLILRHWVFISLTGLGIISLCLIEFKATQTGSFTLLPNTGLLLASPLKIYSLIIAVATFIFSGMLVHLAKDSRMSELIDTAPVHNIQLQASKTAAIALMQLSMLLLYLVCSLAIQVYHGYYYFQLNLYLFHLLVLSFPVLLLWNITSVFIHTIIPNLFLALFILMLLFFGIDALPQMGLTSPLVQFNTPTQPAYSDFHGYGHHLRAFFFTLCYWIVWALILVSITGLLWRRGRLFSFKERLTTGVARMNKPWMVSFSLLLCALIVVAWVLNGAAIQDKQDSSHYTHVKLEAFQNQWASYAAIPMPKINHIELKIDLFPDEKRFDLTGKYLLINQSAIPLDTLLIRTGFDEITTLHWQKQARLIEQDTVMKYQLYVLADKLQPKDSLWLDFSVRSRRNTLFTRNSNVLSNGSFLQHDILPRLYDQFENDSLAYDHGLISPEHYFGKDADYVMLKTEISTVEDQVAIAPGTLIAEAQTMGRRSFTYQTKAPLKFNFSFHSGHYEIHADTFLHTKMEVYYLKNHHHNIGEMLDGIRASLEFNTKLFGPYPHDCIRIVEFPGTEGKYTATLMANNIPTSEKLFHIHQKAMAEATNFPFYVMAHELTHEWFGNELMPANKPGYNMLTESVCEYITLQIYKHYCSPELAQNFLQLQRDRYQNGRNQATKTESPLVEVQAQQEYIAYGKGTLAFNALAQEIGEQGMNAILAAFFQEYSHQVGQYPTTAAFLKLLKEKTPNRVHPLIEELFLTTHTVDFF